MTSIYKMDHALKLPYVRLRQQLVVILEEAKPGNLRQVNNKVMAFAIQHQDTAFELWAAVQMRNQFRVFPIFHRVPFVWEVDKQRLEIRFVLTNFPCSHAEGRLNTLGEPPRQFTKLLFDAPLSFEEFYVRIFCTSKEAWSSRGKKYSVDPSDSRQM